MKKLFALFVLLMSSAVFAGVASAAKLDVAVSIVPEAYFASQVGGDRVVVHTLVAPGQSPHTFEPTARQMSELAKAKIYFTIGMPFEAHLVPKVKAGNPGIVVVDVRKGVHMRYMDKACQQVGAVGAGQGQGPGLGQGQGRGMGPGQGQRLGRTSNELDPHIWMSPRIAALIAGEMAEALIQADPAGAKEYKANLKGLQDRLAALDKEIGRVLEPLKGKEVFVFHPAFGYLLDEYGLKQVPIETMGKSPGPRHLALLVHEARQRGVKVIFVQPQFPQKSAQAIAQAIGGAVVPLDPLAPDYIKNLRDMAGQIAAAAR